MELDNHARLTFRRKGEKGQLKGKPKHPYKLHIWAGIYHRETCYILYVMLFDGIMRQNFFVNILRDTLLPFAERAHIS